MSWSVTLSSCYGFVDPNVDLSGNACCLWIATRASDGAFAQVGAMFKAAWDGEPSVNPDGTTRALDGSGVYVGVNADANTTPGVGNGGFAPLTLYALILDEWCLTFTPGLDTDPDALLNVPLTVSDPAVTSVVADWLTANSWSSIPYATSGHVQFDIYGPATSIAATVGDATWYGGIQVSSPVSGTPIINEPATFTSSDPSVMTITTPYPAGSGNTPDTFILNFLSIGSCSLIVSFPSLAAPNLSQTLPVTVT